MNHIELFAGCGGMSLGFKSCGFELLMANEVSPMAAETFSYNIMGKDIRENKDTLWLESNYSREDIELRLRENLLFTEEFAYHDIPETGDLSGKLIIGSVTRLLEKIPDLRTRLGVNEIDVISGGPPCQGFSMAGLRKIEDRKNQLPFVFGDFVSKMQPKVVVLENVTGILRPFKDSDGVKYYAWEEIAKYFFSLDYYPICLHVNPVMISLPQTRFRFIMIAVRQDYMPIKLKKDLEVCLQLSLPGESFKPQLIDLTTEEKICNLDHRTRDALALFIKEEENLGIVTAKQAIHDISTDIEPSSYVDFINQIFKSTNPNNNNNLIFNLESPKYSEKVVKRFKLQQKLNSLDSKGKKMIRDYLKSKLTKNDLRSLYSRHLILKDISDSFDGFIDYLNEVKTKKHSQRALYADKPSPTITAVADDFVHYEAPRCLNVREMARIQSFPDWFVLRSKITTGGLKRRYEIPQQTQVGNAVPPLLGRRVSMFIKHKILRKINLPL